jgi:ribosomal-protein-alanine N-acetyltransferase
MSSCIIEPLVSPSEIDDILAVENASFTSPWTREMYLSELDNKGVSYFYLARMPSAREVIGFCSFWHVLEELHINNLAVLPAYRRQRIGTDLLTRVLRDGAGLGAHRATLEVRRSNEAARKLYEKFGFTVGGVRHLYYSHPPEDALVLWRDGLP